MEQRPTTSKEGLMAASIENIIQTDDLLVVAFTDGLEIGIESGTWTITRDGELIDVLEFDRHVDLGAALDATGGNADLAAAIVLAAQQI
jgi:hypothetical protein